MQQEKECSYLPDVWALWDGELAESRAAAVQAHLAGCRVCRRELRELRRLSELLRLGDVTPEISPERHEELKQALLERCARSLAAETANSGRQGAAGGSGADIRGMSVLRFLRSLPLRGRRAFVLTMPLAVTVLLLLLFAINAPAQALEKALNAMAQVRSAHCLGWMITYRSLDREGQPIPGRMRMEYWYQAPGQFRRELKEPEVWGWSLCPQRLVVNGPDATSIILAHSTKAHTIPKTKVVHRTRRAEYMRELTPFDFFTSEGFLRRAQREKAARVTRREGVYRNRAVRILSVRVDEGALRHHWTLHIDPSSELILRSEWVRYANDGVTWKATMKQILDDFMYNVPLEDGLFRIPQGPDQRNEAPSRRQAADGAHERGDADLASRQ